MKIDFKLIQKLKHIIVALFFMNTGIYVFAQKPSLPPETIDSAYWGIKKNTYRINLSSPVLTVGEIPEGTGILAGMYELALKRNFSIVSKIGMITYNNPYERILTKYSYHALASI